MFNIEKDWTLFASRQGNVWNFEAITRILGSRKPTESDDVTVS